MAARDLAHLDPGLVPLVEAEIQGRGRDRAAERFLDPATAIGLASLVVWVASIFVPLAYQIHRDRRADARLSADVLRRQVRVQLDQDGHPRHRTAPGGDQCRGPRRRAGPELRPSP